MQKLSSIILCLVLILIRIPVLASDNPDFTYEINDAGGITVTGYSGKAARVSVPGSIDGLPVTKIGRGAFADNRRIKSIDIPEGVREISAFAFDHCDNLKSASIPSTADCIENCCFCVCMKLASIQVDPRNPVYAHIDGVLFDKAGKSLHTYPPGRAGRRYEVPEGIIRIAPGAFFFNDTLTAVVIPDSVTEIGEKAFQCCWQLKTMDLPGSIRTIGAYAFDGCDSLEILNIPTDTEHIGNGAFRGCKKLISIAAAADSNYYCSVDGVLFDKARKTLVAYPNGKTESKYVIPEGTEIIRGDAFGNCSKLKTVIMPEGVAEIGASAFMNCSQLAAVSLPDGLQAIDDEAFANCRYLRDINVPASTARIGSRAFSGCGSLRSLALSDRVTEIGDDAFLACTHLTVTVPSESCAEQYCKANHLKYRSEPALPATEDLSWLNN